MQKYHRQIALAWGTIALIGTIAAEAQPAGAGSAPTNMGTAPTGQSAKGEPYELGGTRLVFTTWEFVRPGILNWVDDKGNGVAVVGNQGPREAHFRRADHPFGIRIVAQPAVREGPIWSRDEFPGSKGVAMISLIQDGTTYKAWGLSYNSKGKTMLYYESTDGRKWTRRDVTFTVDGKADLVMNLGEGTIFIDPSAPPAERYKAVTLDSFSYADYEAFKRKYPDRWEPLAKREDVGSTFYVRGFASPDGIAWNSVPEPLSVEHSDTQITGYYDQRLGKYVIYTRAWMVSPKSPATQASGQAFHAVGRRSIGRMENDTFSRFPVSQIIMTPSPDMLPSDVLYTNCRTTIPKAPFSHIMFPTVWHQGDDSTTVVMASSYDGRGWNYLPNREVFQTPSFGGWDGGCIFARPNLIELPDGTFALPYTGYNVPHKYPRGQFTFGTGYMTWPKGRLVALQADGLGEFATVALMPPGRKLLVNAETLRAGSLQIEVADINGTPLPGHSFADADPIIGDAFRLPATWKGKADLGFADKSPIMLRFKLDRAKIFSLDFE